ncbi:MAG: hypothetical protein H6Q28_1934 [Bacteroidetes bacterium]|nr:hypothetical protein [Bacteroidota bacterium]
MSFSPCLYTTCASGVPRNHSPVVLHRLQENVVPRRNGDACRRPGDLRDDDNEGEQGNRQRERRPEPQRLQHTREPRRSGGCRRCRGIFFEPVEDGALHGRRGVHQTGAHHDEALGGRLGFILAAAGGTGVGVIQKQFHLRLRQVCVDGVGDVLLEIFTIHCSATVSNVVRVLLPGCVAPAARVLRQPGAKNPPSPMQP